eukprot:1194346-Prorocentrum_minimum.AAC.1
MRCGTFNGHVRPRPLHTLFASEGAHLIGVTQGAIRVTQGAIRVTQGAIRVTQGAIGVTQGAIRLTQGAIRVTQGLPVCIRLLIITGFLRRVPTGQGLYI